MIKNSFLFLFLLIILLSCKEESKFDYSLLEGHWVMDSLKKNTLENLEIEPNESFFAISKDRWYIYQVFQEEPSFCEHCANGFNYYISNDSMKLFINDLFDLKTEIWSLKEREKSTWIFKIVKLNETELVIENMSMYHYYSRLDLNFKVKTKNELETSLIPLIEKMNDKTISLNEKIDISSKIGDINMKFD